jgi:hypothetical protein
MSHSVYLYIPCDTADGARRVVALLQDNSLSAHDIRLSPTESLQDTGDSGTGRRRVSLFAVTGGLICLLSAGALATLTVLLFPLNLIVIGMLFALLYCLFFEPRRVPGRRDGPQSAADPAPNVFHVRAQVISQSESERLRIACESVLLESEARVSAALSSTLPGGTPAGGQEP